MKGPLGRVPREPWADLCAEKLLAESLGCDLVLVCLDARCLGSIRANLQQEKLVDCRPHFRVANGQSRRANCPGFMEGGMSKRTLFLPLLANCPAFMEGTLRRKLSP